MIVRKKVNYGLVAFVLIIVICSITLFAKPIIGMADNGDFFRITSQNNLYNLPENKDGSFLDFFYKDYGIMNYYNENAKMIVSTQSILIKVAVFLDKLVTKDLVFDLRFLASIYVIIYAISGCIMVNVFTHDIKSTKLKLLITAIYVVVFCDTGYVAYFNSFYGEAMCLSFFLISVGMILYMHKSKKYSVLNLCIFFILALMFIGSKQQLAPMGVLVAILFIRLSSMNKSKFFKCTAIGLAIACVFSSSYFYFSISGDFDYINRYYAMTRGVMLYEWKSEEFLKEFDINPQYSLLQETVYFNNMPNINPTSEKLKKEFYDKYSFIKILKFYGGHPRVFFKMMAFSVENGYTIKNKVIGNYEKSEGRARAEQTKFFTLWSTIKDKGMSHSLSVTISLAAIYFSFAIKRYIKAMKSGERNRGMFEEVFLYVFLVGVAQLVISIIGAGDGDLGKHVFMFNVTFDIMIIYSLVIILKNNFDKKESLFFTEYFKKLKNTKNYLKNNK